MDNQWYGAFSFDEVRRLQDAYKQDASVGADIQDVTGNDPELTNMILTGPTDIQIDALREEGLGGQTAQDFDAVWGTGAAEHYMQTKDYSVWDHVSEMPGAVARGVAGAVAEFGETLTNDLWFALPMQADMARRLASETGSVDEQGQVDFDADTVLRGLIEEPETVTGQVTEGIVQFAAPFMTGMSGTSQLAAVANAGLKGEIAAATFVGFIADTAFFDEDDQLASVAIADYFGVESEVIDKYLRNEEDDPDLLNRLRRGAEGAALGVATDYLMAGVMKLLRSARRGEIPVDEAQEQAKQILDQIDATDMDPAARSVAEATADPYKANPEVPVHLRPDVAVRTTEGAVMDSLARNAGETSAMAIEAGTRDTAELSSTFPKFYATLESMSGQDVDLRPSWEEHSRAVLMATKMWESTRKLDLSQAWDDAVENLRVTTNSLGEASVRSKSALIDAVQQPFAEVMRMYELGDVAGLREFATNVPSVMDFKLRSEVMSMVARASRDQTNRLAKLVDATLSSGRVSLNEQALIREMFHKQVQLSMEVEALNANLGSAAGAILGQRARHMDIYDELIQAAEEAEKIAKEAGASEKAAKRAARKAQDEKSQTILDEIRKQTKEDSSNGKFLADRYRELTDEGVDPLLAWERVREMAKEAQRNNVEFRKAKNDVQAARIKARMENETKIDRMLRGLEQWRYNAMLSGLKTHETNFMSSFWMMSFRLGYEGIFGSKEIRLAAARKVWAMTHGLEESFKAAAAAYKQMKPILDQLSAFEDLDPVYKNHVLTYPTRLMLATDQFVKHLTYKGEVYASAMADADLAKLTGQERDAFIQKRIDASFDPETGAGMDALAINRAQEVTFQKEFDPDSKYFGERAMATMTKELSSSVYRRFLFPFMRIFFRLTDEGIRMTPGLRDGIALGAKLLNGYNGKPGSSKFYDDLLGHNGKIAQARASGEYAVGLAITGWTMSLVAQGRITGGEEWDYVDSMMREQTAPPYSIRVGDSWFSYERFEPFAFPMKFFANYMIQQRKLDEGEARGDFDGNDGQDFTRQIGVMSYVFGQAVLNNSFMEGIESLSKAISPSYGEDEAWKRPAQTALDSFVPNILRKINNAMDTSDNKYTADPMTWNSFERHFSSVMDMSDNDINRNQFLGEPKVYDLNDDLSGMTNFWLRPVRNDKAMGLIIEANEETGRQFRLKRPGDFITGVDLRDHQASDGDRSLYDKYLELVSTVKLDGKTYREALEELADDPNFNALPWGNRRAPGLKAERINDIKLAYEREATFQLENDKAYAHLFGIGPMRERSQARREEEAAYALQFFRQ